MSRFYIPLKKGLKKTAPDFSKIKTISGASCCYCLFYMNEYEGQLIFSNLKSINGHDTFRSAFARSENITSVSFPELEVVKGTNAAVGAFSGCPKLTTASFSKLYNVGNKGSYAAMNVFFSSCTSLQSIYFSAFTSEYASWNVNNLDRMLSGVTGCTVHFPSNLQSVIGSHSYVTAGFGGTNTTVLFDLPATT